MQYRGIRIVTVLQGDVDVMQIGFTGVVSAMFLKDLAASQGWNIVEEFSDEGMSGALRDRPGYTALMEAVAARQFDIVLFENIDRLGRDTERVWSFYKTATHADTELHQLGRGKLSLLEIGVLSTFAALFLEDLSFKTRRGLAGRVIAGGSGGGLSYGYRVALDERGQTIKGELTVIPPAPSAHHRCPSPSPCPRTFPRSIAPMWRIWRKH